LLVLPSKRLLQYYKNSIKQTTCFNEDNLKWMAKEANNKQVSDFGKHGGLVMDEMSIQDDIKPDKHLLLVDPTSAGVLPSLSCNSVVAIQIIV
jgi:hypothetical protein